MAWNDDPNHMTAPKAGVKIRMYRIGHGDCFLLAFPNKDANVDRPVFVLIDCGLKPGSQDYLRPIDPATPGAHADDRGEIADTKMLVQHLFDATDGHLDLMVITHEHQDHVNAIWMNSAQPNFAKFTIDEAWFAWTEDGTDDVANRLRELNEDALLGLVGARAKLAELAAVGQADQTALDRLDSLLSMELGVDTGSRRGEDEEIYGIDEMLAEARTRADTPKKNKVKQPGRSENKRAMRLVRQLAEHGRKSKYFRPGKITDPIAGTDNVRAFVIGPPRAETGDKTNKIFQDENPKGTEGFPQESGTHGLSFSAAALGAAVGYEPRSPFGSRYCFPLKRAKEGSFLRERYVPTDGEAEPEDLSQVGSNPGWRTIDDEWLYSAETMAMSVNTGINNTSLVLAFELPRSKKVLLFVGDAQSGNWKTWHAVEFDDSGKKVTTKDLMGRTVLYKVGHHGSHNATLHGTVDDTYANLAWMATGPYASEFTAMVTAVRDWAMTPHQMKKTPWNHPLPSIKTALLAKTGGRYFQTDMKDYELPPSDPDPSWTAFKERSVLNEIYFEYTILDEGYSREIVYPAG